MLHCALLAFNHHWAASYLLQRDLTPLQQPLATLHPTPAARHAPGPDCRPDSERVTAAPAAPSPAARVAHSATATRTPSRTLAPAAPASTHCLQQHPPSGPAPSQPRVPPAAALHLLWQQPLTVSAAIAAPLFMARSVQRAALAGVQASGYAGQPSRVAHQGGGDTATCDLLYHQLICHLYIWFLGFPSVVFYAGWHP